LPENPLCGRLAAFIGTVGLDWQFSGVGNFSGVAGETDLLLRIARKVRAAVTRAAVS
jgi:hypothetical protein